MFDKLFNLAKNKEITIEDVIDQAIESFEKKSCIKRAAASRIASGYDL